MSLNLIDRSFTISNKNLKMLSEVLLENKTLQSLGFMLKASAYNAAGEYNEKYYTYFITNVLEKNQTLTELNFQHSHFDHWVLEALALALKDNQTLRSLDLNYTNLVEGTASDTPSFTPIISALETNVTLTRLDLNNSRASWAPGRISDEEQATLKQYLERNLQRIAKGALINTN